ncbi:hypothetical protein FD754_018593 [Muntiacus muntjak]|uniref:Uncharacterized protein n=1 Tax=Muntiacus muntjak TaxID=9888 RepID=A0A5N3UXX9_MUNMU|nr:hypothetical protein FD754_018593 [Muntiacus muntjak]
MRELAAELLCSQIQQEAQDRVTVTPNDSEDENNTDNRTNSDGPSAKWQKKPILTSFYEI